MDSITVRNYRCFGDQQTARLAPITLFVGENSSGKTSLAAMLRALWDVAYAERVPDFKEAPYDLGSFDEIVHYRGARGGRAKRFDASFELLASGSTRSDSSRSPCTVDVSFGPQWGAPVPIRRRVARDGYWIEQRLNEDGGVRIEFGTPRGSWSRDDPEPDRRVVHNGGGETLPPLSTFWHLLRRDYSLSEKGEHVSDSFELTDEETESIRRLLTVFRSPFISRVRPHVSQRPFASAPTRSRPRRTYDPVPVTPDAEGDYVPTYLAGLSMRDPKAWERLKLRLEGFGENAGLFDEIKVRHLGKTAVDPFQIQVRKFGAPLKGPLRNLADVGYGVSQVLPLVTELLRDDGPRMMLLQQPEIHLHPSAEAALGSLLCSAVAAGRRGRRQLIVETHSDFIIDRVCMEVRDGAIGLKPDDVSIVYFERCGLNVHLHSIRVDSQGNMIDVPSDYRKFFLNESIRFLGA